MKKLLVLLMFWSMPSFSCEFGKDIKQTNEGYLYTKECHIKVGNIIQENEINKQKIVLLEKSIELKNLALTKQEERLQLWMDTTYKLEDRVNTIDQYRSTNQWIFFGIGVLTTTLAVYGASQLSK